MKTLINILVFTVLAANLCYAQDEIYKKNGEKIECKIEEIGSEKIKYHKSDNIDGPLYSIYKKDVLVIIYDNGNYEYPNVKEPIKTEEQKSEFGETESDEPYTDFNRNFISVNPLNLFHGNVNFAYRHLFKNGKVALRFPVKIGFGNDDNVSYYLPSAIDQKVIGSLEMDVLFCPAGQHLVSYVTGLGIEGGLMNIFYLEKSVFVAGGLEDEYSTTSSPYASLYYYNGFSIEAGKNFGISVLLGLGPKKFLDVDKRTEFMVNFSFNLGYTF